MHHRTGDREPGPIACTIIARNYLAQARVLAASFIAHHPGGRLYCLVVDDLDGEIGAGEPFCVIGPNEIIDVLEFHTMATMYSIVELATAVKPWLLAHLSTLHGAPVAYFDPDIQIFDPLPDVFEAARGHGIALTPHLLAPPDRSPSLTAIEDVVLGVGVFNLGFVAVGTDPSPLSWWMDRLRRECRIEPTAGRFVDQRWIDLVPGYFTPAILRDPGLNVAWWNLSRRRVEWTGTSYTVNGTPLRFFHFSGYDPKRPWLVSSHQGPLPQVLLSTEPGLRRISDAYGQLLRDAGYDEWAQRPYALNLTPGGSTLDPAARRAFATGVRNAEHGGGAMPPDAFACAHQELEEWLAAADPLAAGPRPVSRYAYAAWEIDGDLQRRFPDPHGNDADALHSHIREVAPDQRNRAPDHSGRGRHARRRHAVDFRIIAAFGADTPEAEIARRLHGAMTQAGIPHVTVQAASDQFAHGRVVESAPERAAVIDLFVMSPGDTPEAAHQLGTQAVRSQHNVLVTSWRWDDHALRGKDFGFLDEVWVCSRSAAAIVLGAVPGTSVLPIPTTMTTWREAVPAAGQPRVITAVADMTPSAAPNAATNALAAFEVYRDRGGDAMLLIAVQNGDADRAAVEYLRYVAADTAGVTVIETTHADTLEADVLLWLPSSCDAAIPVGDALAAGRPVIATPHGQANDLGEFVTLVRDMDEGAAALDAALARTAPPPPSSKETLDFLRERLTHARRGGSSRRRARRAIHRRRATRST